MATTFPELLAATKKEIREVGIDEVQTRLGDRAAQVKLIDVREADEYEAGRIPGATAQNVLRILEGFDFVVDGGDNFPTRYLLNDACVATGKPNIHGSVFRFEGQVTTFLPNRGPCYRCLYPRPPPADLSPSCAEAGVLGVLPGIIGLLQANEALKLVLGIGQPLVGRLLTFDALKSRTAELKLRRDPDCPVCRDGAKVEFIDYEQFCSTPAR